MKTYELMLVIAPEFDSSKVEEFSVKITQLIEAVGGKVEKKDWWGKRNLAYKVGGHNEGSYLLLGLTLPPTEVSNLKKKIHLEEKIIRHLLIVITPLRPVPYGTGLR